MRRHLLLLATAFSVLVAADLARPPALHAQEYATARRTFSFIGRALTIEVAGEGHGALQVVRGEPGRIDVAAHADDGLTSFALGGWRGDRLTLGALGNGETRFIVAVPEHVHVMALLPGQGAAGRVPDDAAVLRWGLDPDEPVHDADAGTTAAPPAPDADGLFLVHRADAAPHEVVLERASLSRVQVRVHGDRFLVRSSQPLALRGTEASPLRLRTGERPIALTITVPEHTRSFRLRSDQDVLLTIRDGEPATACARTVSVRTATGARQYEFVPTAGRVHCTEH